MPLEIEIKSRVDSHEPLIAMLKGLPAKYAGRVLETNRLYDNADGSLRREGRGLRLRSCRVLDGPARSSTLTYKGPMRESALKQREEVEIEVGDVDGMARLLQSLGYQERVLFEKRRESWAVDDCKVELDELPRIGRFVEIEGPSETSVLHVMARLNLSPDKCTRKTYVELIAESQPLQGSGLLVARFTA
jgi:adenylate cyclase class 2